MSFFRKLGRGVKTLGRKGIKTLGKAAHSVGKEIVHHGVEHLKKAAIHAGTAALAGAVRAAPLALAAL